MRRSLPPFAGPAAPRRVDWDFVSFWLAYLTAYFEVAWLFLK